MLADPLRLRRKGQPRITHGVSLLMEHPKLRSLHAYWDQQRAGRDFADRSAFGFGPLKIWLGNIALIEVSREPLQFRMRLFGTNLVELAGKNYTTKWLDKCVPPALVPDLLEPYYECIKQGRPVARAQCYEAGDGTTPLLEQLLLPCSSDQTSIDLIVGAAYLERETSTNI